jgi:hypothetical protein
MRTSDKRHYLKNSPFCVRPEDAFGSSHGFLALRLLRSRYRTRIDIQTCSIQDEYDDNTTFS